MKFFVLIFVSLFFLKVNAQDSSKPSTTTQVNMDSETYAKSQNKQTCTDALKDKMDKADDINDKIEELKKSKIDDAQDLQEKIDEKDADIAKADVTLKEAQDAIQEEITNNEEEKDKTIRDLDDALSKQMQALKKIVITDKNKVERDYQDSLKAAYAQCNIIAQKDLADRKAADRAEKQAQNKGQIRSGGAGFNGNTNSKIKESVVKGYKECLSMAEEALKSKRTTAIEELQNSEAETQSDINKTNKELGDYMTKKYPQKMRLLNEKLNTAIQTNQQTKNSLAQQKATLQAALNDKLNYFDQQINDRNAELLNIKSGRSKKDHDDNLLDTRKDACCKATSKGYQPLDGVNAGSFCRQLGKPSQEEVKAAQ